MRKRSTLISGLAAVLLAFAALWTLSSSYSDLLFPSPRQVFSSIVIILTKVEFLVEIGISFARILASFLLSFVVAAAFAGLSRLYAGFCGIASVLTAFVKATPLASIALILFFFMRNGVIPIASAFLLAFPVIFSCLYGSLSEINPDLHMLCSVYGITRLRRMRLLFIPSVIPAAVASAKAAFPIVIKVVVSTEILAYCKGGMGRRMENARLTLDSAMLFAWTFMAIFICIAFDLLFKALSNFLEKKGFLNVSDAADKVGF